MKRALMQRSAVTTLWMILSGLMAITALVGFWPTYYGPLIAGTLEAQCTAPGLAYKQCFSRPIVHLHGAVFRTRIQEIGTGADYRQCRLDAC